MTTREKLEKVLEFIINEENEKASDLLHDVFVEKARGIYEEIATEDEEIEEATEEGPNLNDMADEMQLDRPEAKILTTPCTPSTEAVSYTHLTLPTNREV